MNESTVKRDELDAVFAESERGTDKFLIGAESEKFGVHQKTGQPLGYGGDFSVCRVLSRLSEEHGWSPIQESEEGPVIGLRREGASITLEPSAQLELSGAPLANIHLVAQEARVHVDEIRPISEEMGLAWLTVGFHPLARRDELEWVPKQRYPIMRRYLPERGRAGLDMMQRTATVQGNFDWSSEADAMKKLRLALKLSPLMQAWFSNAPFVEGRVSDSLSLRADVWRNMDPSRSGLIRSLWGETPLSYSSYTEWALDAGMFLFKRQGRIVENTGQTFRSFMKDGYQGQTATLADWKLHLTTLFPEVRLKNTLEVRSVDGVSPDLAMSTLAIWTGLLYDEISLNAALELTQSWTFDQIESERGALVRKGLHSTVAGRDGFERAAQVFQLAESGLRRRSRRDEQGRDETTFLGPALEILEKRRLPAEDAIAKYQRSDSLIEATCLDWDVLGGRVS